MKQHIAILIAIIAMAMPAATGAAPKGEAPKTTKRERVYIAHGNSSFSLGKYGDAEDAYRKALEDNPYSEVARYNLGVTLLKKADQLADDAKKKALAEASSLLSDIATHAADPKLRESADYNLGNLSYHDGNYAQAIEYYKQALRLNPDNDRARDNLRLAQKKLQQQQQNQDQQQQQDQQDQQDKQEKKDEQPKDQPQQPEKKDEQPPQQQPQGSSISDSNADQILKAMENQENAIRQRVNARAKQGRPGNASHGNPW